MLYGKLKKNQKKINTLPEYAVTLIQEYSTST